MKNSLGIIAPCYNEEKNIEIFYQKILTSIKDLNINYKFFFIDDGSTDATWDKIKNLKKSDKNISLIKFSRNFGQMSAIQAGILKCDCDYTIILDSDLQDPPELLKEMYNKILSSDLNVVYAQRKTSKEKFFKKITTRAFYKIFNFLAETKIPDRTSNFKIFDRKVLGQLKRFKEQNPFYMGIIPWIGFKTDNILFDRPNRLDGSSGWTLKKMVNFSIDAILSFSSYPMRISFYLSILMSFLFIILSIYALYSYFLKSAVPGWTSIVLIISFFNIIIFFILGLISEYVGRIFQASNNRPNYIVEEEID